MTFIAIFDTEAASEATPENIRMYFGKDARGLATAALSDLGLVEGEIPTEHVVSAHCTMTEEGFGWLFWLQIFTHYLGGDEGRYEWGLGDTEAQAVSELNINIAAGKEIAQQKAQA